MNILHIDNESEFRDAFRRVIEELGASVDGFVDSNEMLGQDSGKAYDMVFVDSSGFDAARYLQHRDRTLRVIVLSADVGAEHQENAARHGVRVDAWIDKNLEWPSKIQPYVEESLEGSRLLESYDGHVVESHDGTAVVIYEVGNDVVEQVYEKSQFEGGRLPPEGARLRARVEVTELPAGEVKLSAKITTEGRDDPGGYGPDKLTEPIDF